MGEVQAWGGGGFSSYLDALSRAAIDGRKGDLHNSMAQDGFLDDDPKLAAEDLYRWAVELLHEAIVHAQPVTYTSENLARAGSNMFDLRDRTHPIAKVSVPKLADFAARIQLDLTGICATPGASPAR